MPIHDIRHCDGFRIFATQTFDDILQCRKQRLSGKNFETVVVTNLMITPVSTLTPQGELGSSLLIYSFSHYFTKNRGSMKEGVGRFPVLRGGLSKNRG